MQNRFFFSFEQHRKDGYRRMMIERQPILGYKLQIFESGKEQTEFDATDPGFTNSRDRLIMTATDKKFVREAFEALDAKKGIR